MMHRVAFLFIATAVAVSAIDTDRLLRSRVRAKGDEIVCVPHYEALAYANQHGGDPCKEGFSLRTHIETPACKTMCPVDADVCCVAQPEAAASDTAGSSTTMQATSSANVNKHPFVYYTAAGARPEPEQRMGVEYELKTTLISYEGKCGMCKNKVYAYGGWSGATSAEKAPSGYKAFDFGQWSVENGHHAIFKGIGECDAVTGQWWAKQWSSQKKMPLEKLDTTGINLHLDANGANLLWEFVTDPYTPEDLAKALNRMKHVVNAYESCGVGVESNRCLQAVIDKCFYVNKDIDLTQQQNKLAIDYLKHMSTSMKTGAATKTFHYHPQITTTLTVSEMKRTCEKYGSAVSSIWDDIGKPADDNGVKTFLSKQEYKDGGKGSTYLVKHFAEALGDNPKPPANWPAGGLDKVKEGMGLHTRANKPSFLVKRDNELGYFVEVRGDSPSKIEEKIGKWMNGELADSGTKKTKVSDLVDILNSLHACPASDSGGGEVAKVDKILNQK